MWNFLEFWGWTPASSDGCFQWLPKLMSQKSKSKDHLCWTTEVAMQMFWEADRCDHPRATCCQTSLKFVENWRMNTLDILKNHRVSAWSVLIAMQTNNVIKNAVQAYKKSTEKCNSCAKLMHAEGGKNGQQLDFKMTDGDCRANSKCACRLHMIDNESKSQSYYKASQWGPPCRSHAGFATATVEWTNHQLSRQPCIAAKRELSSSPGTHSRKQKQFW